jgi:hypothetical protein
MREAAGDLAFAASRLKDRIPGRGLDRVVKFSKHSHVIEVSNVSLITPRRISRSIAG